MAHCWTLALFSKYYARTISAFLQGRHLSQGTVVVSGRVGSVPDSSVQRCDPVSSRQTIYLVELPAQGCEMTRGGLWAEEMSVISSALVAELSILKILLSRRETGLPVAMFPDIQGQGHQDKSHLAGPCA